MEPQSRIDVAAPTVTVRVIYGANRVDVMVPVGAGSREVAEAALEQHDIQVDMKLVTSVEFDGKAGGVLLRPRVTATTKTVEFKTKARENG
jgi:RNA-binding protein YlmH